MGSKVSLVSYFRSAFSHSLKFSPFLGVFLILIIGIPRFIIVLGANATGNYKYTSLIFVFMCLLPFLLLNRDGQKRIGIVKTKKTGYLFYSLLLGVLICVPVFLLGTGLYGMNENNWFVYISRSYSGALPSDFGNERLIYFAMFAGISMIFSPIGEELMYRGFIHQCFESKYSPKRASQIDSLAFALTHLAHFGILFTAAGWVFRPVPALLWIICTYLVSRVFFFCKQKAASLGGAILSHAGFNLAMNYFIFYHIL